MWDYLKHANKPIVLYGMGNGADKILNKLDDLGIPVSGVFASDGFVRDKIYRGFKITSYSKAKEHFGDMIVLLCFGSQLESVIDQIKHIAAEQELYAPDVPVFGNDIFDEAYAKKHEKDLSYVYSILEDEKSKFVFENIIKYKLSGKIDYLFKCQSRRKDDFSEILKLGNNEVFMDLGAYRGDTVMEFVNLVDAYKHIYAIEPNKKSFEHLKKNTSALKDCECINISIHNKKGTLIFNKKNGRNSAAADVGKLIEADSVDNIILGKYISYIKMDVEGQELNALDGAKNTILKNKPKLLISAYHRSEDLFSLPMKVLSIRDDYKVYIRHNPYIPAWDTNFYFV